MAEIPWYTDASLVGPGHVFCVGSLAQCVRKWSRLAEIVQTSTHIQLGKAFEGRTRLECPEMAVLAAHPDLKKV